MREPGSETAATPATGAETSPPVLHMTGVTVGALHDPGRVVFTEVNWSVAAGEFWAIGGLHASGKSDFLATVAGLVRPLAGSYRVFGRELGSGFRSDLLEVRLRLGMVFDGGRMLHHLTVAENVALPWCYHRLCSAEEAARRIAPWLEATGLTPWAGHLACRLGRNWQQRVGLARALVLRPEVLLLDSPLSGLDPQDEAWWLAFLRQLSQGHPLLDGRPLTLVVTGDNLRPWKGLAGRFAVLRGSRFVPLGGPADGAEGDSLLRVLLGG